MGGAVSGSPCSPHLTHRERPEHIQHTGHRAAWRSPPPGLLSPLSRPEAGWAWLMIPIPQKRKLRTREGQLFAQSNLSQLHNRIFFAS